MKRFVPGADMFHTFSVVDLLTGLPADVGATSVLLLRSGGNAACSALGI